MYVGVIRAMEIGQNRCLRIPHVCGGDPSVNSLFNLNHLVFPMYVGVILSLICRFSPRFCIPHVCGGDPEYVSDLQASDEYSPCMWG